MGRRRPPREGMTEKLAPYLQTFSHDTEVLELQRGDPSDGSRPDLVHSTDQT